MACPSFLQLFQAPPSPFDVKVLIKMLIQWIICTDQPFTVAEHPLFLSFLHYLKPDLATAKGFSDSSIHHQILLMFAEERKKVYEVFTVGSISILKEFGLSARSIVLLRL